MVRNHRLNAQIARVRYMQDANLACELPFCQQKFNDIFHLIRHLKSHIENQYEINCPYLNSGRKYQIKSSFTSHISRMHRVQELPGRVDPRNDHVEDDSNEEELDHDIGNASSETDDSKAEDELEDNYDDLYLHNLALFYLRLQTNYYIPSSTVQAIVEELNVIHSIESQHLQSILKAKLNDLQQLDENIVQQILRDVQNQNLFGRVHNSKTGQMRSQHIRKNTIQRICTL